MLLNGIDKFYNIEDCKKSIALKEFNSIISSVNDPNFYGFLLSFTESLMNDIVLHHNKTNRFFYRINFQDCSLDSVYHLTADGISNIDNFITEKSYFPDVYPLHDKYDSYSTGSFINIFKSEINRDAFIKLLKILGYQVTYYHYEDRGVLVISFGPL